MAEAWEEAAASWVEGAELEDALARYLVCPAAHRGLRCTVRSISVQVQQPRAGSVPVIQACVSKVVSLKNF